MGPTWGRQDPGWSHVGHVTLAMWVSNYINYKVWGEIIHPFPNFKGYSVEVWGWISNGILHFMMSVITYPCWDLKLNNVSKRDPWNIQQWFNPVGNKHQWKSSHKTIHVLQNVWQTVFIYSKPMALTHWGREKMAAVSQTTLLNAFSWINMFEFRLKFQWSLFLRFQLTIFQHRFR